MTLIGCQHVTDELLCLRMHVETLKLFSALVQGRNVLCVEFLLTHADFFGLKYDLLLAAIENPKLPKFYRRYLIEIIHHIFVDCEPHTKIKFLDLTLVTQKEKKLRNKTSAGDLPRGSEISEVNNAFFKFPGLAPPHSHAHLMGALVKILNSIGCFTTHNYDANLLLASCLTTLNLLLQFGM